MDTKALRQKILDLAIRGKLVPQDQNDEPANVLLEKIRAEKQQMIKDGKLKAKDIKNDSVIFLGDDNLHYEKFPDGTVKCIEDEIPFELPEGWEWCRLRDICYMVAGKSKSKDEIKNERFEGCFPCYGGNGQRGYVDTYNYDGTYSIVGRQGALCGNINIATGKFYATEHAVVVTLYNDIDFYWSSYILEALNLNQYATGAAQPGLSVNNVLNVLVCLPPYEEQCAIAHKLKQSIDIIEKLELDKSSLLTTINQTKSKILDLAIRGKLVPQNPDDEPASVLLERIRTEKEELIKQGKIKRDKKESVIFKGDDNSYYETIGSDTTNIDDEIPFDLPDEWVWCRLPNISEDIFAGGDKPAICKKNKTDDCDIPIFSNGIENDGLYGFTDVARVNKPSITISARGTIGFCCVRFEPFVPIVRLITIIPILVNIDYLKCVFQALIETGEGSSIPQLTVPAIKPKIIPVPPLSEQKRIADKASQLFSLLDSIAENIN